MRLIVKHVQCRFALPHPHQALGLPVGQHITLRAEDEGSEAPMLLRPYTPVSVVEQTGQVVFVIKVGLWGSVFGIWPLRFGLMLLRPYTPVSVAEQTGQVDFVINKSHKGLVSGALAIRV